MSEARNHTYPFKDDKRRRNTPWGASDDVTVYADGIEFHNTPGHGGFWLSNDRLKAMPDFLAEANKGGRWFEEDCDWSLVVTAFPNCFSEQLVEDAKTTLRNWHPSIYERLTGIELKPGESHTRDRELFDEANKDNLVVVAAKYDEFDPDMVCIMATKGGTRTAQSFAEARYFLTTKEDYRSVPLTRYVVDESKLDEVDQARFDGQAHTPDTMKP